MTVTVVTTMDKIEVAAVVEAPTDMIGFHRHESAPQCAVFTR